MRTKSLVFVDIETTGFSPSYHRITEVGIVVVANNKIVDEYQTLINPDQPINCYVSLLTGITEKEVKDAPYFDQIAPQLTEYFNEGLFVAHNAGFDHSFLRMEYQKVGEQFNCPRMCTMLLSRKLYPEYRNHRLSDILERHNILVDRHHRALDDARATAQFYLKAEKDQPQKVFEQALSLSIRA